MSVAYLKGPPAEAILDYPDFQNEVNTKFSAELLKDNPDPQPKKTQTLQLQSCHNKVVFDAYNEALDFIRPWGLKERPLPWKVNINKIKVEYLNERNMK